MQVYMMNRISLEQGKGYSALLADLDVGLVEVSHLLACLALPWSWLAGLLLPSCCSKRPDQDQTDLNLKLAKQNKSRNIVKYK